MLDFALNCANSFRLLGAIPVPSDWDAVNPRHVHFAVAHRIPHGHEVAGATHRVGTKSALLLAYQGNNQRLTLQTAHLGVGVLRPYSLSRRESQPSSFASPDLGVPLP